MNERGEDQVWMKVEDERALMEQQARGVIEANFTEVEQPRDFYLPTIRFEAFGDKARKMEKFTNVLTDWLKMPYVHDRFGEDAQARRAWRREQQEAYAPFGKELFARVYKEVAKNNKLRAAVSSTPGNFVENILFTLEEDPTDDERALHDQIEALWNDNARKELEDLTLSIDKQIVLLKSIEDQLVVVLRALADYTQRKVAGKEEAAA